MNTPHNTNPAILKQKINDMQPDWNQNNPSATGYIKNRTHYENIVRTYIVPETTIDFDSDPYPKFAVGHYELEQAITIEFDGTAYESVIKDGFLNGDNAEVADCITVDGLSIAISFDMGYMACSPSASATGTHKVSVYTESGEIKRLDAKYLPEPFTVEEKRTLLAEGTPSIGTDTYLYCEQISLEEGKEYTFIIDGVKCTGKCFYDSPDFMIHLEDEQGEYVATAYYDQIALPLIEENTYHKIELFDGLVYRTIHDLMIIADLQDGENEPIEDIRLVAGDFATAKAKIFKGQPVAALTCLNEETDVEQYRINTVGAVSYTKIRESEETLFVQNFNAPSFIIYPDNTIELD